MDHAFHAAAVARRTVARLRVVRAAKLRDVAFCILDDLFASDQVGVAQAHLRTGTQAVVFLGRDLHEVVAFDIDLARERHLARAGVFVFGIIDRREKLGFAFGVVGDDDFQRVEYRHAAFGDLVQVFAHAELQLAQVDHVVALGYADHFGEVAHRSRRITLAAQGADGRHAGIVPAHHGALLHEFQKTALGHHRIGEVQTGEFVLVRGVDVERLDEPVVERTVHVEFEGADRVGDPFD